MLRLVLYMFLHEIRDLSNKFSLCLMQSVWTLKHTQPLNGSIIILLRHVDSTTKVPLLTNLLSFQNRNICRLCEVQFHLIHVRIPLKWADHRCRCIHYPWLPMSFGRQSRFCVCKTGCLHWLICCLGNNNIFITITWCGTDFRISTLTCGIWSSCCFQ